MREKDIKTIKTIKNIFKGLKKYEQANKSGDADTSTRLEYNQIDGIQGQVNFNNRIRESENIYGAESVTNKDYLMFLLYEQLDRNEKKLIDMKYRDGLKVREISNILYISESTYYRKTKKIFEKLLGYYNIFADLFK